MLKIRFFNCITEKNEALLYMEIHRWWCMRMFSPCQVSLLLAPDTLSFYAKHKSYIVDIKMLTRNSGPCCSFCNGISCFIHRSFDLIFVQLSCHGAKFISLRILVLQDIRMELGISHIRDHEVQLSKVTAL